MLLAPPLPARAGRAHPGYPFPRATCLFFESACRSKLCLEHDLFRKPVSTFRDHALCNSTIALCDLRHIRRGYDSVNLLGIERASLERGAPGGEPMLKLHAFADCTVVTASPRQAGIARHFAN